MHKRIAASIRSCTLMPEAFQSCSRNSIRVRSSDVDVHRARLHLFGGVGNQARDDTAGLSPLPSPMAAISRSAGQGCGLCWASDTRSEIEAKRVCSSLTTPEISRPTAAIFSRAEKLLLYGPLIEQPYGDTDLVAQVLRQRLFVRFELAGPVVLVQFEHADTSPCANIGTNSRDLGPGGSPCRRHRERASGDIRESSSSAR